MIERYCTEISSPRTFSSRKTTWLSLEISVSRVYSVKPNQKPRQLSARHITCLQRLFNQSHTVLNRTYGHLACFFMKCVRCSHPLTRRVSISSQGKLSLDSIMMCLIISVRMSRIYYRECLMWTQRSDLTLTQFSAILWSLSVSKSCWRKTILEMNSRTLFCTTRTFSTNSKQSRPRRKRKKRESKNLQLRRHREHSREWLSCDSMNTNRNTDRTRSSLMKCSCITLINCTNRMSRAASRPRLATQQPSPSGHSRSRLR